MKTTCRCAALMALLLAASWCRADFPIVLPPIPAPEVEIWVAPDGDDAAEGTKQRPLATFAAAVKAAAAARQAKPEAAVCVYFGEGVYPFSETVTIDSLAGTADKPILFRSAPGAAGKVRFSGTASVQGWEPLAESDFWREAPEEFRLRVRPEAVGKILTALYTPYRTETYAPNVYGQRQEMFVGSRAQTLARWPNDGFAESGQALGATPLSTGGHEGTAEGIFEAAADQPPCWDTEPVPLMSGYWFFDWSESFEQIESIEHRDDAPQVVHIKEPHTSMFGYRHHFNYYGFNLLCELDTPGEYYIDREADRIFWIPREGEEKQTVELVTFDRPWFLTIENCAHLVIAGLTFDGGMGGLAAIHGSDSILLADTTVKRFGQTALEIIGGSNCGCYHTDISTLGLGGIFLQGGDRKTLTESGHFLSHCKVFDFSRLKRTYAPAFWAGGCGIKVEHCEFAGSSSSAASLGTNELVIEYCYFHDLVRESDDQGGIDAWFDPSLRGNIIRYNLWEDILGGPDTMGAAAVRLDDIISGFKVYGNIFVHCGAASFGAVQIHGGKDNIVENNIFLDCNAAVSFNHWGERYTRTFNDPEFDAYGPTHRNCYEEVDITSELWQKRYPELSTIAEDPDVNTVVRNWIVNCPVSFKRMGDMVTCEGNVEEKIDGATVESLCRPDALKKVGLEPIPLEEIGPKPVRFLKD
ncbi:MAG: right-handed parallel beta-helix repeat-containing protein [Thermoguttaceae bacterium]|nr:right-handed parallel beta-helix repeat-containing protein [Thermoguttaceae bacterium]